MDPTPNLQLGQNFLRRSKNELANHHDRIPVIITKIPIIPIRPSLEPPSNGFDGPPTIEHCQSRREAAKPWGGESYTGSKPEALSFASPDAMYCDIMSSSYKKVATRKTEKSDRMPNISNITNKITRSAFCVCKLICETTRVYIPRKDGRTDRKCSSISLTRDTLSHNASIRIQTVKLRQQHKTSSCWFQPSIGFLVAKRCLDSRANLKVPLFVCRK